MTEAPIHIVEVNVDPAFTILMHRQAEFQRRLHGMDVSSLEPDAKMAYIREMAFALTAEVHEAADETGWKSWATSNHINRDAYLSELADVFIFLMNMLLVSGHTAMDLANAAYAKQTKNHKRQDEGYDGVSTKCINCHRALDDEAVECLVSTPEGGAWCAETNCHYDSNGNNLDTLPRSTRSNSR